VTAMCRMAWFPPHSARDPATLRPFIDALIEPTLSDPAGAGAGWVWPGISLHINRKLLPNIDGLVSLITTRPGAAWGMFHARRAPAGQRASRWCHPHVVRNPSRVVLVTYNGMPRLLEREPGSLWALAQERGLPCNPRLVARLIARRGWAAAAPDLPQTAICYQQEASGLVTLAVHRRHERFPLFLLANGTVASLGLTDSEYAVAGELALGDHDLLTGNGPQLRPIPAAEAPPEEAGA
jgi:hypothetical protein